MSFQFRISVAKSIFNWSFDSQINNEITDQTKKDHNSMSHIDHFQDIFDAQILKNFGFFDAQKPENSHRKFSNSFVPAK